MNRDPTQKAKPPGACNTRRRGRRANAGTFTLCCYFSSPPLPCQSPVAPNEASQ